MSGLASWQLELKDAVNSIDELLAGDYLPQASAEKFRLVAKKYKVLLPQYYLGLINKNDPQDPIALMAIPQGAELEESEHSLRDPIGDLQFQVAPRLTHRYKNRALLHVTNLCPMYCRFCFRKNLMNEKEPNLYAGEFEEAFQYLAAHGEIRELILTGGDPWMLSDERLNKLLQEITLRAPHITVVRFHTRMPVTLPSRVNDSLLRVLQSYPQIQFFVVTHFNHPREVTDQSGAAMKALHAVGVITLNQSVLLRGVNDSVEVLKELFLKLSSVRTLPYYLHHCDQVAGAEFFSTSIERGRDIWKRLRSELPGYLIPEYILDIPGGMGKIPLGESFLSGDANEAGAYEINFKNKKIPYIEMNEIT